MSGLDYLELTKIYQAWSSSTGNSRLRPGEQRHETKIARVGQLKPVSEESTRRKYESLTQKLVTEPLGRNRFQADYLVRYLRAVDALCAREIIECRNPKVARLEWSNDGHHT